MRGAAPFDGPPPADGPIHPSGWGPTALRAPAESDEPGECEGASSGTPVRGVDDDTPRCRVGGAGQLPPGPARTRLGRPRSADAEPPAAPRARLPPLRGDDAVGVDRRP